MKPTINNDDDYSYSSYYYSYYSSYSSYSYSYS